MKNRKERIRNSILGFIIGDCMGVPYEFRERGTFTCISMGGYGTHNQPPGTWSDDTSMMLATIDSIVRNKGKVNIEDLINRFLLWYKEGHYTQYGEVFDIGNQTKAALDHHLYCKEVSDISQGNGSLMRILPLAFIKHLLHEKIDEVSQITHPSDTCSYYCKNYIRIAHRLLGGKTELGFGAHYEVKSSGYIKDTYYAIIWTLSNSNSFNEAILKAVNLGGDTDTIAALTGALAGLYYNTINEDWLKQIPHLDQYMPMVEEYIQIVE